MVKGSSFAINTLRLKMNDFGKAQRWTEDDILMSVFTKRSWS